MPRIDPIQLLNCLSVLLSPKGGVKSKDEVERLAGLMTKFSKKLVSKCIYIQILKCTETELLGLFMVSGGWRLVHTWLTEGITANNWPLVRELLELLLLCPVGIDRLKTNNCPKLVKELSKDEVHHEIRALASKLVEQWLKTVKGEEVIPIQVTDIQHIINGSDIEVKLDSKTNNEGQTETIYIDNSVDTFETVNLDTSPESDIDNVEKISESSVNEEMDNEKEVLPILKITLKNGKQIISQVDDDDDDEEEDDDDKKSSDDSSDREKSKDKYRIKKKDKSHDKSRSRSSSSRYSSKSSSSDKNKSSHKSSSSSSKHSSKDRSKEKEKYSSHSSRSKDTKSDKKSSSIRSSSNSSRSKDRSSRQDKEKSREKDKDHRTKDGSQKSADKSEPKPQSPSIQKLGKIPKLSDVKREKPSISIEIRKPDEPKPKTVKTFNSKFRKHGLEEEVKPPPSRASLLSKKPPPVLPPTVSIPKRPSPVHNETPPEKKSKILDIEKLEKPGSIKLIPPKPKPMMLQESDMFMDALNASATNKKEPKKRKRRTSGSKDGNAPNDGSPPHTPSSPNTDSKSIPPRFYQDTLETEENKEKTSEKSSDISENARRRENREKASEESMDTTEPHTLTVNGIKGVLCYHKRKGPKKSIRWKPDSELEEIQYFELDETERVNVTKTFTDMKHLERINERDAFQKARNLSNDDIMEEKTNWRPLIQIDAEGQIQVEHGKNSKEKDVQAVRQKGTLQPLYFHKSMIPDSPFEPDPETHVYSEPSIIPLDDTTGNQDNISDFRNMPWPEPKGNAPATSNNNLNVQPIFPTNLPQFPNNNFPVSQFPGVPTGFQGPPMVPGDWPNGVPPHMMPNGIPPPMAATNMPSGAMPPGNMPPGIMVPTEGMMMGPEIYGPPNPMFPGPPEGFNMQQNMFPIDYSMSGLQGPPGPEGFGGPAMFRGAMRGRGAGGHWRGKTNTNWEVPLRGRGGSFARGGRKAVCIYFQRKGSCRQGENCSFLHPGVNCPF